MMRRIVYTRHDGGVDICQPAPQALRAFCNGGGFPCIRLGALNNHIDEEINAGRSARFAMRYVHGLAFGGLTEAEAFEIIRERDCAPGGTGFEIWDLQDIPTDRWFRNAWCRSHNGGPVYISMPIARKLQLKKLQGLAAERKIELQLPRWRARIRRAATPEALKAVWPEGDHERLRSAG
jgi:hypothetical protein